MMSSDSFGARSTLEVSGRDYEVFRLDALQERFDVARLPYSIKVLLENVLRLEDGVSVSAADVEAIAGWDAAAEPSVEIPFQPARVLMQDFTGVPAVVDLAAMRDAMEEIGGDPAAINPLVDVDLVIDHSVQVDAFGNAARLRASTPSATSSATASATRSSSGASEAFDNFRVVPPATGICHQVNLEHLAQVVYSRERDGVLQAYPDTLVGTDSHTTMVNGLGVLGWGVGGIEAEAAMLGQPISMLLPQVVGFKLGGELPEGATATDLVLTVTEMLRERGVVSKFVEFFGPGPADPRPRRPGDARQHVAGVRLDLRDLPGRRRDAALPRPHRPPDRDDRAGRRLRPRAGHVPRRELARPGLLRPARARPRRRRAQHRRPETAAGPGAAGRGEGGLPRGDGGVRPRGRPSRWATAATRRSRSPSPPPTRRPRTTTTSAASRARRSAARRRRRSRAAASDAIEVTLEDGTSVRARPRPGRDRGDHQLHQHLQPERDGRRRPARPQRGRTRPRRASPG